MLLCSGRVLINNVSYSYRRCGFLMPKLVLASHVINSDANDAPSVGEGYLAANDHNANLTTKGALKMPAATLKTPKRALADSTKAHANPKASLPSPSTAKRRKLDIGSSPSKRLKLSQNGPKLGSSQPKSQFEEEVLEKLTQDISGLKQRNSEKDQQWERPGLADFDEGKDALVFQQIEAEEGTLNGGRTTVKLFGVTEVKITPDRV